MGSTKYIMSMGELTRKDNSLCFRKDGKNVYIPVEVHLHGFFIRRAVAPVDVPGAVIVRVGTGSFIKHRNSPF